MLKFGLKQEKNSSVSYCQTTVAILKQLLDMTQKTRKLDYHIVISYAFVDQFIVVVQRSLILLIVTIYWLLLN